MASLWRIFEARNTYALSKFHREHMHLGIDNASFGFGVGMRILYNWDLFINNGNIMARPYYLLLFSARDGPTNSSQLES
jgi:hypothetical protein